MRTSHFFLAGILAATTLGALANIPLRGAPSGSTAITPEVSEIQAKRHDELSFDPDLKRLSALEGRYRENLPRRAAKASPRSRTSGSSRAAKRPAAHRG